MKRADSSTSRKFLRSLACGMQKAKSSAFLLSVTGVYILAPQFGASAATFTWNGGGGAPVGCVGHVGFRHHQLVEWCVHCVG